MSDDPTTYWMVITQGLEKVEAPRRQRLRAAYDEWRDAVDEDDPDLLELHEVWIRMVIQEALEYEDEILVPRERLDDADFVEALLCLEKAVASRPPYNLVARYVHLLASKAIER